MDYSISPMQRHSDGFYFATVKSYISQREITVHNRYGAWFGGDPDAERGRSTMIDLNHDLCGVLQDRKIRAEKEIAKIASNPFVGGQPAAPSNPFMQIQPNPFMPT